MPKIVDHDQYREELLDRCFDLLSEKGFSKVTMREIARELDVSTGALYHYFPSKMDIMEQLLLHKGGRDVEEVVRRTSATGSFEDRLNIFFEFFVENEGYFQKMLMLAIDFIRNTKGENSEKFLNQWIKFYVENMVKYLELPTAIAQQVIIFFTGLVFQARLFPKFVVTREQMETYSNILFSYLSEHNNPANRLCRVCPFLTEQKSGLTEGT